MITVAVDFDGTCVDHRYPLVGEDVPEAARVLKRLADSGCRLILWTMRSGSELEDAVAWFEGKGIPLWCVNCNREQHEWTSSPKAYAQCYIDDAALGCPLGTFPGFSRPAVDWLAVESHFFETTGDLR
jgi:hypothetical protein